MITVPANCVESNMKLISITAVCVFVFGACADERMWRQCPYEEGEFTNTDPDPEAQVCPEGMVDILPATLSYPCDDGDMCSGGCTIPPPCGGICVQCSPCGNGICECDKGENECNCKADCE